MNSMYYIRLHHIMKNNLITLKYIIGSYIHSKTWIWMLNKIWHKPCTFPVRQYIYVIVIYSFSRFPAGSGVIVSSACSDDAYSADDDDEEGASSPLIDSGKELTSPSSMIDSCVGSSTADTPDELTGEIMFIDQEQDNTLIEEQNQNIECDNVQRMSATSGTDELKRPNSFVCDVIEYI